MVKYRTLSLIPGSVLKAQSGLEFKIFFLSHLCLFLYKVESNLLVLNNLSNMPLMTISVFLVDEHERPDFVARASSKD